MFLEIKQKQEDFSQLKDINWIADLAFAVDIVSYLCDLNLKLQGKSKFVHEMHHEVKAFMTKLLLFTRQMKSEQLVHFKTLQQVEVFTENLEKYYSHLEDLHIQFSRRFNDFSLIESDFRLLTNPFNFVVDESSPELQLQLIELTSDFQHSDYFKAVPIDGFYSSLNDEKFPRLKHFAKKLLVYFGSTYICEQTFSIMKHTKSQLRSDITNGNLEAVLRIATSEKEPDNKLLAATQKQLHQSH